MFNQTLRDNLNGLIARDCQRIDKTMLPKRNWWRLGVSVMAFHFLRHFPAWVGWLPAHTRGWPESARRSSRKLKLRTASSLQPWIIHYEQITSPLADGEKSADRALFIAVIVLLVIYAQKVDWQDVWKVIAATIGWPCLAPLRWLSSATSFTAATICSVGPIAGTSWRNAGHAGVVYLLRLQPDTQHRVGGIGMRYRLYSRLGLNGSTITRIFP